MILPTIYSFTNHIYVVGQINMAILQMFIKKEQWHKLSMDDKDKRVTLESQGFI